IWSCWFRWRLLAGSVADASFSGLTLWHYAAGGIGSTFLQQAAVPTGAPLRTQRVPLTWQVTDPDAVSASHRARIVFPAGVDVDFILRLGGPQIQPGGGGSDILPPVDTVDLAYAAEDQLTLDVPDGTYALSIRGGTVNPAGIAYAATRIVSYGQGLQFNWPPAARAAGERHLQSISMRKTA
ncbi:hypothetical protein KPL78_23010, partial [Roseomonas sp. HJA6]|nr:hypothetical protein [Neoroseomonas alba]